MRKAIIAIIIILIVSVIFFPFFNRQTTFTIENISDLLLFFITINSILCGFSTNNESKILSITSEEIIQKLKGSGIIKERENLVTLNFKVSVLSILISSVLYMVIMMKIFEKIEFLKVLVYILMILTIIGGYLFIKSSSKIKKIIKIVYDDKCPYSEEEKNELKNKIKNLS